MGVKQKKLLKKKVSKAKSLQQPQKDKAPDFMPLEGGHGKDLSEKPALKSGSSVVYVGRIPHGFYEKEMEKYFSQFGKIKRLKIARNKKTGKSKHYGFIEFEVPEVAEVVADCMHNYLLFEHLLQVYLIPPENVRPKSWRGVSRQFNPINRLLLQRRRESKVRTLQERAKVVEKVLKRDRKRRQQIAAAGIDYECPPIVGDIPTASKRIKLSDD